MYRCHILQNNGFSDLLGTNVKVSSKNHGLYTYKNDKVLSYIKWAVIE